VLNFADVLREAQVDARRQFKLMNDGQRPRKVCVSAYVAAGFEDAAGPHGAGYEGCPYGLRRLPVALPLSRVPASNPATLSAIGMAELGLPVMYRRGAHPW
jgi:hypothetical protein